jgi:hypothetical protein
MLALTVKESPPRDVDKAPSPAGPFPARRAKPSPPTAAIPGPARQGILIDLAVAPGVRRRLPMSGGDGPATARAVVPGRRFRPGRFRPARAVAGL